MSTTEQWQRDGYLVSRGVFDAALIGALRAGCDATLDQWRRESVAEGEPGGYCHGPQAWVLIHLNHPKYYRERADCLARLLNAVADARVLEILDDIFRAPAVLTQINYYMDPSETRATAWHRDSQFFHGVDSEEEREAIGHEGDPPRAIHMHIPLARTRASEIVPGSHVRLDGEEEGRIRRDAPGSDTMPGALGLALEPGDLGFFHVNALHRGIYTQGVLRRTIAVTFTRASDPYLATAESMAERVGYVASYQPWFLKRGYLDGCVPAARGFYERFIDVHRESWREEYVGSLHARLREYFTEH